MLRFLRPTKGTLLATLVLIIGSIALPLLYSFAYNFYLTSTLSPDQFAHMIRQKPTYITVINYFIINPLLTILWLYVLVCIIVFITKRYK